MNDWNPNHGGKTQYKKKEHFAFDKDTSTIVFRILPQPKGFKYGSVEYNNTPFDATWHKFHSVIFGYKNMEGKYRIFESPQVKNNKTKMIEVPCAATDRINDLKAKLEEARVTGNEAVMKKLNALVGLKSVYSINNNQHLNVMLLDGRIGELQLRYKAFLNLKVEIDKLRAGSTDEAAFDPLSFINGRFFTMTRNTLGRDTTFPVNVYEETVEIPGHGKMKKPLVHVMTPEIFQRLEVEGWDLDKIHLQVTSEECAQIVAESDLMTGKSPACNRIFDDRWKAEREARKATQQVSEELEHQEPEPEDTLVSHVEAVLAQTPDTIAASEQAAANTLARIPTVAGPTAQARAAQAPATQAAVIEELSDADFFAQIGVK